MKTIYLSAGHSNTDPGAVSNGLKEADLNKIIVQKASDVLRSQGVGVLNVPDNLDLYNTIKYINQNAPNADLAVEIHINAGGGTGLEGWYYKNSSLSKGVVNDILASMIRTTGMKSRGAKDETTSKYGKLGFVHDTKPLAVLIECGFIDSEEDRKILTSTDGLYRLSLGLAQGIVKTLKLVWKEPEAPKDAKTEAISLIKGILADSKCDCLKLKEAITKLLSILQL